MTTRAEPEDHLWSADHSLRDAALDEIFTSGRKELGTVLMLNASDVSSNGIAQNVTI